jgi:flagellar protein FlgJ
MNSIHRHPALSLNGPGGLQGMSSLSGTGAAPMASDLRSLQSLRNTAAQDPKGAIEQAAKQIESLFMQELLKSMRRSTLSSGMLDNQGSEMGTEMLDQQYALQMSGRPGGLAQAIMRQFERQMGAVMPDPDPSVPLPKAELKPEPKAEPRPQAASRTPELGAAGKWAAPQAFLQKHGEAAREAQQQTGIPAAFMLAQAGHETGWGKKRILNADGSDSHNVFGIKAGPSWKGPVATVTTTEYINGEPRKVQARFRAYANETEAFADYAKLMKNSPRYSQVLAQADSAQGFAQGLQKAGYATDPAYAEKLGRAINTTLRLQRLQA